MRSTANSWEREIFKVLRAVCVSAKGALLLVMVVTGISCLERAARAQQSPPPPSLKGSQSSVQTFDALPMAVAASGIESAPDRSRPTPVSTEPVSSSNSKIPNTKSLRPALSPATSTLLKSSQAFIENRGQFPERVRFQLKTNGKALWLTNQGIVFDAIRSKPVPAGSKNSSTPNALIPNGPSLGLNPASRLQSIDTSNLERLVFSQDFVGAHCSPTVEAIKPQPGVYNYFFGNDPKKWATHVKRYEAVVYHDLWDGIDLKLYPNGLNLEQEFIVRPGGDLNKVQVSYQGAEGLKIADDGSLIVRTAFGELHETKPRIYQEIAGQRVLVDGKFKLTSETAYTFEVNSYQPQYALVIDPTLLYSTFLGGSAGVSCNYGCVFYDQASAIAVDASGSVYVTGFTASADWPVTSGAYRTTPATIYITKLNPQGSQLVYSTFLGQEYIQEANAIAVSPSGEAYVVGVTQGGFPTTPNAFNRNAPGGAFVTVLAAAGDSLIYSSYLAPYTHGFGVAVGPTGNAYVTGCADAGLPTTPGAFQSISGNAGSCLYGSDNAYLAVFNPSAAGASSLVYCTYLSGTNRNGDNGYAVAADQFGMAYVTGFASSTDFPITPGAYQTSLNATSDVFIAKLNPNASGAASLIYSTYLGGSIPYSEPSAYNEGLGIAIDNQGNAYVTGYTSTSNFPTTQGALQTTPGLGFVTKLNAAGNGLVYSTYINGSHPDPVTGGGVGIALDTFGDATVAGTFAYAGFVNELNSAGTALVYSATLGGAPHYATYVTGVAVDSVGDAYVTGETTNPAFPTTPGAFQPVMNPGDTPGGSGPDDAFVTKFPHGAPQGLLILRFAPTAGGNAGNVTPEIVGNGFHAGATVQLACGGGATVLATKVLVAASGGVIDATFNLVGTSPGICDLVVTNPDGSSVTLAQAFTVQQGGAADVRISKIGTTPSPGHVTSYSIAVTNAGNVDDTNGGTVTEFLDTPFSLVSVYPPAVADVETLNANHVIFWNARTLRAGSTQVFTYQAAVDPSTPRHTPVLGGPVCYKVRNQAAQFCAYGDIGACSQAAAVCTLATLACIAPPLPPFSNGYNTPACLLQFGLCLYRARTQCANYTKDALACIDDSVYAYPCTSYPQDVIAPGDPNNLVGTTGVGNLRWISGGKPLQYILSFGNEPSATAPAQQVSVTDPIGTNFDLVTLRLTGINLVGVQVPISPTFLPAAGQNEFTTNVDLRPVQNLFINVDAKLDPTKRTLVWTFTSIDPITGLPPTDAAVGFLPPGGQGNVSFTVRPTQALATGTSLPDQGSVVFDALPATPTNTWLNTIDDTPPTSRVSSLPATVSCADFKVSWSGSDVGSGTKSFTVYASDNGAEFVPWLTNTSRTSAVFKGQLGHTYSFYSLAQDLVGNVEASKTSPEATTQVTAAGGCGAPSISGSILSQQNVSGTLTLNLQFTDTGTSDAVSVSINHISFRTLGGTGTVTLTSPALPISVGNISVGSFTPLTLTLNVPATVKRFSITEGGTLQNTIGATYNFSIAQLVSP